MCFLTSWLAQVSGCLLYTSQGFRVNVHTEKNGAERDVDMMIKKLRGEPYVTELPMPVFDRVKPAPAGCNQCYFGMSYVLYSGSRLYTVKYRHGTVSYTHLQPCTCPVVFRKVFPCRTR